MSTNYIPNGSFETDENWNFYGSDTTPTEAILRRIM